MKLKVFKRFTMKWKVFKMVLMSVLIWHFCLGVMLIDYGASFKCFKECNIGNVTFESLILRNIEPRVVYHLGLIFVLLSFLILQFIYSYELIKE